MRYVCCSSFSSELSSFFELQSVFKSAAMSAPAYQPNKRRTRRFLLRAPTEAAKTRWEEAIQAEIICF